MLPASPTLTPLECNAVFPDRPRLYSLIQPPGVPRSKELNPDPLHDWDPSPSPCLEGGLPLFLSPILDHGADSSPPLAGMDWGMDVENLLSVSYP